MKIRIKGNSLRYRVTRSEVNTLAKHGKLEDQTEFISGKIIYAIESTNEEQLSADLVQDKITLYVPCSFLKSWAESEQIGIDRNMSLQNGESLYLLLEKDFKCIDADMTEDQSDYFENPEISC